MSYPLGLVWFLDPKESETVRSSFMAVLREAVGRTKQRKVRIDGDLPTRTELNHGHPEFITRTPCD